MTEMIFEVNEESTAYLQVSLLDRTGANSSPLTLTFRVHDVESGTEMVATTSISPVSPATITLTPTANTILKRVHKYETRRVTVDATYGSGDVLHDDYDYLVRNLEHVSG